MNLVRFNRHPFFADKMDDIMKNILSQDATCSGNYPAVNIQEDDKQFIIEMAAPGLKKEDFKINLEDHVLTISKEAEEKKEEAKENYTRKEFVYSSFSRSFRLPKTILENKIKADYQDGVLNIGLPKDAKAKLTREISVN
jgi:HSP20 family protein